MKIRLLFNGFRHSHINALYKKAIESDAFDVIGCIEENSTARAEAEKNLGIKFSDKSYDEWLSDPEVDAVAVGNAYGERGNVILKALRVGKHVIADKPICISAVTVYYEGSAEPVRIRLSY